MGIFARELAAIYDALADGIPAGIPSPLPELPVQYLDFALWQREWLAGEVLEQQLSYWRRQLASVPPLELPTDRPRPAVRTHNGTAVPLVIGGRLHQDLKKLAQREGSTLFIVLMAAFKALLHHWTTQEDISVGTLIANRRRPEIEGLIGFFANSLVLRTDLSGDPTFRELLRREREVSLDAYAHQDVPFEKLVEELNPPRDMARTPLFQVMLILLNAPGEALDLPGLKLQPVAIDSRTSKMEITLYLTDTPAGLDAFVEYNTDLFDRATMARLLGHYTRLLETVAARPRVRLSGAAAALGRRAPPGARGLERHPGRHGTRRPPPSTAGSRSGCGRPPRPRPSNSSDKRLTYGELDRRANRLARHLRGLGVGPDVLVGLAMERSLDMLVGVLGRAQGGRRLRAHRPRVPEGAARPHAGGLAGPRPAHAGAADRAPARTRRLDRGRGPRRWRRSRPRAMSRWRAASRRATSPTSSTPPARPASPRACRSRIPRSSTSSAR